VSSLRQRHEYPLFGYLRSHLRVVRDLCAISYLCVNAESLPRFPTTTHLHPVTNEQRRVRHGARPKQASSTEFEKFPLLDPYYPIRLITFPVSEFQVNPRRPKEQSAVSNTAWDQKYEETP